MSELVWWPHKGYGRELPDEKTVVRYDDDYFEKCRVREGTEVGKSLIEHRGAVLCRHSRLEHRTVDVGVGALGFVNYMQKCGMPIYGYDVNSSSEVILRSRDLFDDPTKLAVDNVTCWDSLEHMLSPEAMLRNVRKKVLMSLPIFDSAEHVIRSKHYKPGEHIWYFTEAGLIRWMRDQGFGLLERNRDEERYGREGIGTYVFARL
jgi:hypothetical protein